ncbi:plexin-A4-like protein [Lates japonicus]|uniref:Plexin-A4-like protein n=1 Tax=Lates japonicus TaxID=270547 RepID=A0AAD3QW71_LATJO|nr:plexin-A4-like protein [Lates japonicus]
MTAGKTKLRREEERREGEQRARDGEKKGKAAATQRPLASATAQPLLTIDDDFCGLDMNAPLGVSEMVRGKPVFSDAVDKMTSVIAYVYKNHSLVFVGTKSGRVKKVRRRNVG